MLNPERISRLRGTGYLGAAALAAVLFWSPTAPDAAALIQHGSTFLGVNDEGHLNFFTDGPGGFMPYGLFRDPIGDSTSPGCLCEGWGVALTDATLPEETFIVSGWASVDNGGIGGLDETGTFGSTPNTATSIVQLLDAPIQVKHEYGPSLAQDIFQAKVTITNLSADRTYADLVYRRAMDWDVPPTEFDEFVTHQGVEANLESNGGNVRAAVDNGFVFVDPSVPLSPFDEFEPGTFNTDFVDSGPNDHGSAFDFAFGELAPGESRSFNIFYGSAPDEATAVHAVENVLQADVYSLGQSNTDEGPTEGTPATFIFAFGGVGGVAPGETPESPELPFVPAPGEFVFTTPEPRQWFDPPFSDTFLYELVGADPLLEFVEVAPPPDSFGFGAVSVFIQGFGVVATLDPGEIFNFLDNGFSGITSFMLTGINPLLDSEDPGLATAFPTFLDFNGVADELHMSIVIPTSTGVPVPATLLLLMPALAMLYRARRRLAFAA